MAFFSTCFFVSHGVDDRRTRTDADWSGRVGQERVWEESGHWAFLHSFGMNKKHQKATSFGWLIKYDKMYLLPKHNTFELLADFQNNLFWSFNEQKTGVIFSINFQGFLSLEAYERTLAGPGRSGFEDEVFWHKNPDFLSFRLHILKATRWYRFYMVLLLPAVSVKLTVFCFLGPSGLNTFPQPDQLNLFQPTKMAARRRIVCLSSHLSRSEKRRRVRAKGSPRWWYLLFLSPTSQNWPKNDTFLWASGFQRETSTFFRPQLGSSNCTRHWTRRRRWRAKNSSKRQLVLYSVGMTFVCLGFLQPAIGCMIQFWFQFFIRFFWKFEMVFWIFQTFFQSLLLRNLKFPKQKIHIYI